LRFPGELDVAILPSTMRLVTTEMDEMANPGDER
jgi:hypothetical protein